jgi:hypothetical protein
MAMAKMRSKTERLRPDLALGATDAGLSLPQHEDKSDAVAEQKHQVAAVAMHVRGPVIRDACAEIQSVSK